MRLDPPHRFRFPQLPSLHPQRIRNRLSDDQITRKIAALLHADRTRVNRPPQTPLLLDRQATLAHKQPRCPPTNLRIHRVHRMIKAHLRPLPHRDHLRNHLTRISTLQLECRIPRAMDPPTKLPLNLRLPTRNLRRPSIRTDLEMHRALRLDRPSERTRNPEIPDIDVRPTLRAHARMRITRHIMAMHATETRNVSRRLAGENLPQPIQKSRPSKARRFLRQ